MQLNHLMKTLTEKLIVLILLFGQSALAFPKQDSPFSSRVGFYEAKTDEDMYDLRDREEKGLVIDRMWNLVRDDKSYTFFCVQTKTIFDRKMALAKGDPQLAKNRVKYSSRKYHRCFYTGSESRALSGPQPIITLYGSLSQITFSRANPIRRNLNEGLGVYQFEALSFAQPK